MFYIKLVFIWKIKSSLPSWKMFPMSFPGQNLEIKFNSKTKFII